MNDLRPDLLDSPVRAPPPPSELDELISRDPTDLSSADIDKIIAMERDFRAKKAAGLVKVSRKRGGGTAEAPAVDIMALIDAKLGTTGGEEKPKPSVGIARRF